MTAHRSPTAHAVGGSLANPDCLTQPLHRRRCDCGACISAPLCHPSSVPQSRTHPWLLVLVWTGVAPLLFFSRRPTHRPPSKRAADPRFGLAADPTRPVRCSATLLRLVRATMRRAGTGAHSGKMDTNRSAACEWTTATQWRAVALEGGLSAVRGGCVGCSRALVWIVMCG